MPAFVPAALHPMSAGIDSRCLKLVCQTEERLMWIRGDILSQTNLGRLTALQGCHYLYYCIAVFFSFFSVIFLFALPLIFFLPFVWLFLFNLRLFYCRHLG